MRRLSLGERSGVPNSDGRAGQVPWAPVGDFSHFYVQADHLEVLLNGGFPSWA